MKIRVVAILTCAAIALAASPAARSESTEGVAAQPPPSWSSPSLRSDTVVGPNGAVTTHAALLANDKWASATGSASNRSPTACTPCAAGESAASSRSRPGRAGSSSTRAITRRPRRRCAPCSRRRSAEKVEVAAILLTHWHYANGIGAWLDEGAEVWGHEHLDRNRNTSSGISVLSGTYQARAAAQFGVFHPRSGRTRFRTCSASRRRSCWPGPATRRHAALPGRARRRSRRRGRAGAGRPCTLGHERQCRLLFSAQAHDRDQLHGAGRHLQRVHAARRTVS